MYRILVPMGELQLISCGYPGMIIVKFWGSQLIMAFNSCKGVKDAKPRMVQGSTVHSTALAIVTILFVRSLRPVL